MKTAFLTYGPARTSPALKVAATAAYVIGGVLLVWSAYVHFHLWQSVGYRKIPTIGPLFLLQSIAGLGARALGHRRAPRLGRHPRCRVRPFDHGGILHLGPSRSVRVQRLECRPVRARGTHHRNRHHRGAHRRRSPVLRPISVPDAHSDRPIQKSVGGRIAGRTCAPFSQQGRRSGSVRPSGPTVRVQRKPAKRSSSGVGAPVVSRTRTNIS